MEFYAAKNLIDRNVLACLPWEFNPENAEWMRTRPKTLRKSIMKRPETAWQCYSPIRGLNPALRVSSDNPATALNGLVLDYDAVQEIDAVRQLVAQMEAEDFKPQFIEQSLSRKIRLVWLFDRSISVNGNQHCEQVMQELVRRFKLATLLPGYDAASTKATQLWTNGVDWYLEREARVPWDIVLNAAIEASGKTQAAKAEVSLKQVAEEVEKRWPGRWKGEFVLDATGVRFWDPSADNETGCQIKPDGMLCFTGTEPFVRWAQILGQAWVEERRQMNICEAAKDIFYDGQEYWLSAGDRWVNAKLDDLMREFRLRGIVTKPPKGQTYSDADLLISHIQKQNRVDGALPIIAAPPGIWHYEGSRLLNTSTLKALVPAERGDPHLWPLIYDWYTNFFANPELGPYDYFTAWLSRFYRARLEGLPLMGQAVFICGPVDNGKTLLALRIVKPLVGGKSANPYDCFVEGKQFNYHVGTSPLLTINDEDSPVNEAAKSRYLAKIKALVVNPEMAIEKKYKDQVQVPYLGRFLATLNDDPSSTGVLVEVTDSTKDKLMFFRSRPYAKKWPARDTLEATLAKELPHFAKFLLTYQPPPHVLSESRMGVKSYFDPTVLAYAREQYHSFNLRELLALWVKHDDHQWAEKAEWKGNPTELHALLSLQDVMAGALRHWTIPKMAKALDELGRSGNCGVHRENGRTYRIEKEPLIR